jgi:hypothetical protein
MGDFNQSTLSLAWPEYKPLPMAKSTIISADPVKSARKALKRAEAQAEADRRAAKAARRIAAQAESDRQLGLETLRSIARDERRYSADARIEAAKELLNRF